MGMNAIRLAEETLEDNEFALAQLLSELLADPRCKFVYLLVGEILPVYSEKRGESSYTLQPDPIYRPLYYIHSYSSMRHFDQFSRAFVAMTGAHIEGCLLWLTEAQPKFRAPSKPFGNLVWMLFKAGILPEVLSDKLLKFNTIANIPAKHFGAYNTPRLIDERTFSIFEAALDFIIMRNLSMQLFDLLQTREVVLPHVWKKFDPEWLSENWRSHGLYEDNDEENEDDNEY
jgi:hypothetical protein